MRFDGSPVWTEDDEYGRRHSDRTRALAGDKQREEWAAQRALGRLCCRLAPIPGAGHSHGCPNHEVATCPTCKEMEP